MSFRLRFGRSNCQKKDSPYLPGKRVKHWLKFKRKQSDAFIICGYLPNQTSRGTIASLLVGAFRGKNLQPFGMVGTGFTCAELAVLYEELNRIKTDQSPFALAAPLPSICWLKPVVVCEVEYLELTEEGLLRHPCFKRIRPDLKPQDCQFED